MRSSYKTTTLKKSNFWGSPHNGVFNLQKTVEVFRKPNELLFKECDGFLKVFSAINDDINIFDAAFKSIGNVKQELIEKKIATGDYQYVFVNLSAKLETMLKNKFKLDGKLSDMLSEARRRGLIDKDIISDLHSFRENRNTYIHPDNKKANFKASDLQRWNKEIFNIGGEK